MLSSEEAKNRIAGLQVRAAKLSDYPTEYNRDQAILELIAAVNKLLSNIAEQGEAAI